MYIINTYVSEIYIILNFEDIFDKFDIICQIWFDDALFKKKNYTPILLYVLIDGKIGSTDWSWIISLTSGTSSAIGDLPNQSGIL